MDIQELSELMHRRERICPELRPWIQTIGGNIKFLNHPLVQEVYVDIERGALLNHRLKIKKAALKQALKAKNFNNFVILHERPYRIDAFKTFIHKVKVADKDYWSMLSDIWSDSENIWQNKKIWSAAFNEKRPDKLFLMDDDEQKAFNNFKSEIKVYRGYVQGHDRDGMSWTLSIDKANWFAGRYRASSQTGIIVSGKVRKKDIHAYLLGRGEQEIVSENVRDIVFEAFHRSGNPKRRNAG